MNEWLDGRTDGCTDGWMDGWMDGREGERAGYFTTLSIDKLCTVEWSDDT
jgi:hypothetical protein